MSSSGSSVPVALTDSTTFPRSTVAVRNRTSDFRPWYWPYIFTPPAMTASSATIEMKVFMRCSALGEGVGRRFQTGVLKQLERSHDFAVRRFVEPLEDFGHSLQPQPVVGLERLAAMGRERKQRTRRSASPESRSTNPVRSRRSASCVAALIEQPSRSLSRDIESGPPKSSTQTWYCRIGNWAVACPTFTRLLRIDLSSASTSATSRGAGLARGRRRAERPAGGATCFMPL